MSTTFDNLDPVPETSLDNIERSLDTIQRRLDLMMTHIDNQICETVKLKARVLRTKYPTVYTIVATTTNNCHQIDGCFDKETAEELIGDGKSWCNDNEDWWYYSITEQSSKDIPDKIMSKYNVIPKNFPYTMSQCKLHVGQ